MRIEYIFIFIVLRMTTSLFVPVSFQRCTSQHGYSVPRTVLRMDGVGENDNSILPSLDYFVSVVEKLNNNNNKNYYHRMEDSSNNNDSGDAFRIISRGANDLPPTENVETKIFYDPSTLQISIATVEEHSEVNLSKIRRVCSNQNLVPVPTTDMIQYLCGFPSETVPPLGHFLASKVSSCTIVFDETLLEHCQSKKLLMIGGAGHPYWKSVLSAGFIGRLEETGEVRIADITACDSDSDSDSDNDNDRKDDDAETEHAGDLYDGRVWEVSSSPIADNDRPKSPPPPTESNKRSTTSREQLHPKPYFPIDGPPINIAQLVVRQKEISNPLTPVFLTVMGRIGVVKTRTKRSLRCEFLPPLQRNRMDDDDEDDGIDDRNASHPWRSAVCNRDVAVDLTLGKVLLQNYGTKGGEALIENIREGQLVQIEAKTNPGQRESIEKWVDTNSMELTVMDCQLLSPTLIPDGGDPSDGNSSRSKPGNQSTNKAGSSSSSSSPTLSLGDIYKGASCIRFVNNLDTLTEFSNDISELSSEFGKSGGGDPNSRSPFVGIDCEWQPREFMEKKKQPQPVLLLQISLHALERVYILDLQALLRPLQASDTPMNHEEQQVSDCLARVMNSESFVKVGYQLSSDLRRVFASYPHLPCFREIRSTVEVSSFIKKVLQITKQKKSRYITMSLASMASHYLGMSLDKEHQLTDWALRDLTPEQLEYAALDAAVPAKLLETVLESIEARVSIDGCPNPNDQTGSNNSNSDDDVDDDVDAARTSPRVVLGQPTTTGVSSNNNNNSNSNSKHKKKNDNDALAKEIVSMRFLHLGEHADEGTVRKLGAKQYVGPSWIAASVWTAIQAPPPPLVAIEG